MNISIRNTFAVKFLSYILLCLSTFHLIDQNQSIMFWFIDVQLIFAFATNQTLYFIPIVYYRFTHRRRRLYVRSKNLITFSCLLPLWWLNSPPTSRFRTRSFQSHQTCSQHPFLIFARFNWRWEKIKVEVPMVWICLKGTSACQEVTPKHLIIWMMPSAACPSCVDHFICWFNRRVFRIGHA